NRRTSVARSDQVSGPDRQPEWVVHRANTFVYRGRWPALTIAADTLKIDGLQRHWYTSDAVVSPKRYQKPLDKTRQTRRIHTTVSGSERLGSNWNDAPRLTLATDTSGSSAAGVSVSTSSAVQSVRVPLTPTERRGFTAVAAACSGCTDSGEH